MEGKSKMSGMRETLSYSERQLLKPTKPSGRGDLEPDFKSPSTKCGRWGEVESEKGPVDLFPTEPTDEAFWPRRP